MHVAAASCPALLAAPGADHPGVPSVTNGQSLKAPFPSFSEDAKMSRSGLKPDNDNVALPWGETLPRVAGGREKLHGIVGATEQQSQAASLVARRRL